MKAKFLLFIFFAICTTFLFSQTYEQLLQKYWNYRDRLKREFIVISSNNEPGTNIPAVDKYSDVLSWGDANSNLSHYISVLATEYRLLKNNGQDFNQTIHELKYAFQAIDRLDLNAETYFGGSPNLNGFFIRDDVNDNFWSMNQTHFGLSNYNSCFKNDGASTPKEMSQDNIWHLLEGLSLVKELVDDEFVEGSLVHFKNWAQNITYRVINNIQHQIPYTESWSYLLSQGFVNAYWYLKNPITNNYVQEGNGTDFSTEYLFSFGIAESGNFILDRSLWPSFSTPFHYSQSWQTAFMHFSTILNDGNECITISIKLLGLVTVWEKTICPDFYSVRTLATVAGVNGVSTYNKMIYNRDNITHHGPYEHFPLLYIVLHAHDNFLINQCNSSYFEREKAYYENLLIQAPCDGPHNVRNSTYNENWSSTSRLVWPENNGQTTNAYFNGLDYMLLFNLYSLAYIDDFRASITVNNTSSSSVSRSYIISNSTINPSEGQIDYIATRKIFLKPDFHAQMGSHFIAKIGSVPEFNCFETYSYTFLSAQSPLDYCISNKNDLVINFDDSLFADSIKFSSSATLLENAKDAKNISEDVDVIIFPNPSNGEFVIYFPELANSFKFVEITDMLGETIYKNNNISNNAMVINILDKPKGIYLVRVKDDSKYLNQKVVVQ